MSVCRVDKNLDRYPPELRKHINERMTDRTFLPPMRVELQNWLDTLPIAPDLDEAPQGMGWKQKFESFTIYGEGKLVKTLGTIYNPITDRPAAVDLREWVMKQKAGRYEHIMAANEYLDGLRKQGYNKAYVYHTSGDSVYIALFSDPNNKNRPGVVKLNGKPVQVLVRFSNDTSGIKEKECLQEWKGETASALVERTMKWFKTLKNASQKKVSMADILGSMEEDNFDGVNSHPSDLGLSKKPEIRGDEDNDPCFLSLPNRRKSKKASTQPSTYVLTVKNKFPKAFVKPSFPSPYIRRPKSYTVMDGVVTSPEIDEEGFPACTQISDECDTAIAAWESAASRLKAVEDPPKKAPEVTEVVFTNLAVASTVVNTYQHIGMTKEMLPKKGMAVWLVPPIASGYIPVKVSWTDTKSTHGERLYRCEHCKPMSEKHLEQGKAATSRMESKMTTTTITVGEVTAEVRPSGWNISLDIYKSGKRVFRVLMANGQTSREPSSSEIAKIKAAGFDPATKRVLMSNPPCTLGTELALAIDAVSLQIKADADAATAEEKAAIDGIEGLKELRAALNERERYSEQFAKMMDDEHNDGVRPPRPAAGNTDDLRARYPRAAAYILAEAWGGAAHDVKASAGNKAVKRILAGDDYAEAIAEMKATWAAHCDQHVWD